MLKTPKRLAMGAVLVGAMGAVLIGLLVAGGQANGQSLKKITFITNYSYSGRYVPIFVGVEKGIFEEAGFDVSVQPSQGSAFAATAVGGGKADYGLGNPAGVVRTILMGAKVKIFGAFADGTTVGLAATKPYPKLEQVLGKTVGTSLRDGTRVVLPLLLEEHNLDPSKVTWINADPATYAHLLVSGRVDFISATIDGDMPRLEQFAAEQGKKVHFHPFFEWGYDMSFGYAFITSAKRLEENPEEVKTFAAALVKSVEWAMANPEEGARIMVKLNPGLDLDLVRTQWKRSIPTFNTDFVKKHGYGALTRERVQNLIDFVKKTQSIEGPITPDEVYAHGFFTQ